MEDDLQDFEEENKDFMEHVAAITGKEPIEVIGEDREEDYYEYRKSSNIEHMAGSLIKNTPIEEKRLEPEYEQKEVQRSQDNVITTGSNNVDSRVNGARSTSFRIKTLHPIKETPPKAANDQVGANEDPKFHFSRKFAHYLNLEKADDTRAGLGPLASVKVSVEKELEGGRYDKERDIRKVPLKLANGIIGSFGMMNDQLWEGANGGIGITSIDGERESKGKSYSALNRSGGRNENSGKNVGKKTVSPAYQQAKIQGNYVAPKLFELNVNTNTKEDASIRSTGNNGGGPLSLQGFGMGTKGSGRGQLYPRDSNPGINYFHDSQASIQRYYNFLAGKK
jgi:hypothetical protein